MTASVVIIGAGQAGFQCAASLREHGWDGRVVLVGDEPEPPYQRPPLSKEYLRGESTGDELPLRPGSFFDRNAIDLITGDKVQAIDRAARHVRLSSGSRICYDHLVLATGAAPRLPAVDGSGLAGTAVLRTLDDAARLRAQLPGCGSLVIVGGGFIGTEVAASAAASCAVTILESAPRILARSLSAPAAQHVRDAHRVHGVQVRTNAVIARLRGEAGTVRSVELADGRTLDAGLVLFATGVAPRTRLAADAGLGVANGVVVNEALQTSDPRISAIGDCANFPAGRDGGRTRLESVQNAVGQARHVAARIATGSARPYDSVPWFWTHQYAEKIQIAGIASDNDEWVLAPGRSPRSFSVYRVRDGAVVAVESVNAPRDHMRARKSLAAGPVPLAELGAQPRLWTAAGPPGAEPISARPVPDFISGRCLMFPDSEAMTGNGRRARTGVTFSAIRKDPLQRLRGWRRDHPCHPNGSGHVSTQTSAGAGAHFPRTRLGTLRRHQALVVARPDGENIARTEAADGDLVFRGPRARDRQEGRLLVESGYMVHVTH